MRRRIVLASTLAALGVVVAAVALLVGQTSTVPTRTSAKAAMLACLDQVVAAQQQCLGDAMAVAGGEDVLGMEESLAAAIEQDGRMVVTCHEAAHSAGTRLFRSTEQVAAVIAAQQRPVCDYGVVHGLLEGYAAADTTLASLPVLLAACDGATQLIRPNCADGIGHALYESTSNVRPAIGNCRGFAVELNVIDCVSGVLMQFYRPANPAARQANPNKDVPMEWFVSLCSELSDDLLRQGCVKGSAYPFANSVYDTTGLLSELRSPLLSEQALNAVAGAVANCRANRDFGDQCEQMLAYHLSTNLARASVTDDRVCDAFRDKAVTVCRSTLSAPPR